MFDTPITVAPTPPAQDRWLGWRTILAILAFHMICLFAATYPAVRTFPSRRIGAPGDPYQHLWVMRWYRTCLLEGRLPVVCPELQYPIGAPLGNYSPLHIQSLLYIPLSAVFDDVLSYNVIWLVGMLSTGLGTSVLIWQVIRHRGASAFGGMLAMLSMPMMLHGLVHLDLIFLGGFPLFLAAWMRFIDGPSRGRLAAAVVSYLLVALCAAYYAIFAIVPAVLYLAWGAASAGRSGDWRWPRARLVWLAAFAAAVLPCLAVIFANQLWSLRHGYALPRTRQEFDYYGSALWTYFIPSRLHWLYAVMPFDAYNLAFGGNRGNESYLGIVTAYLLLYCLFNRVRLPAGGYLWAALVTVAVLSCGSYWSFGSYRVSLPAAWLKEWVPGFAMIRVPSRFNMFAVVLAAVLAAAALRQLLDRLRRPASRAALFLLLAVTAVADLSIHPFPTDLTPPLPAAYLRLRARDPHAVILELPQYGSEGSALYLLCGYWQSQHRLVSNIVQSGNANVRLDDRVTHGSPFLASNLSDPSYLASIDGSGPAQFGIVHNARFEDYVWLYLMAHGYRYIVLHQWPGATPELPVRLDQVKSLLADAKIDEDETVAVYDRERLRPPGRPTLVCTDGWKFRPVAPGRALATRANLAVYSPSADQGIVVTLIARARRKARTARLLEGDRELARWRVAAGGDEPLVSPPLRLAVGIHHLTFACDDPPRADGRGADAFQVAAVYLVPPAPPPAMVQVPHERR
jgi:hypothetical protein